MQPWHQRVLPQMAPEGLDKPLIFEKMICYRLTLISITGSLIKRIEPTLNKELLALQGILIEWNSPQVEEAWRDL